MQHEDPLAQKTRHGINRILHATGYSIQGLKSGWKEPAFKQEAILAFFMVPGAFFLGQTALEIIALIGSVLLVLMVELLNTAIESAIDRMGPEWNVLSKRAKDLGSAAVLLALIFCSLTWVLISLARFTTIL
jgi:diacylglycerol kinase (ATP)